MTHHTGPCPLAVCVFPAPPANAARTAAYPDYIHEILASAGIPYITISELTVGLAPFKILLTIGSADIGEKGRAQLHSWIADGGQWIAVSGACGMEDALGVALDKPTFSSWGGGVGTLGEGYLAPSRKSKLLEHLNVPLHFFNGVPMRATEAKVLAKVLDAHQRKTERVAVVERKIGKGRALVIAADVTGTVVLVQQGAGVMRDGVPSGDGTAPVCDEVLKSGDGGVLDWIFDRQPVPGVSGFSAFLEPVADLWRELLVRSILDSAEKARATLPILWYYPKNLPAIAHLSHDTDGNDPQLGRRLLEVVNETGIKSTWCTILPGYDPEIIGSVRDSGHELAMHYDSMTTGLPWSEEQFERQFQELTTMFSGERPVTNKNHYLRWEGDIELLEWCQKRGIQLDQSKGASKTGEAGYNFGTSRPYFCVRFDGSMIDVLELPTPTQDLEIFAPAAIFAALLQVCLKHYGVVHLLFHPAHIGKPGVAEALQNSVREAEAAGLVWWTGKQINDWERARRSAKLTFRDKGIAVETAADLHKSTWVFAGKPPKSLTGNGETLELKRIQRWGFDVAVCTVCVHADTKMEFSWSR